MTAIGAVSSPITIPVHRDPDGSARLNGRVATGEVAVHFMLEADPGFQHGLVCPLSDCPPRERTSPGC